MKAIPLRRLKAETDVLEAANIGVIPSAFRTWGEVAPIMADGECVGFYNVSPEDDVSRGSDTLPLEFFAHEMLDTDFDVPEALASFLGRYGVPSFHVDGRHVGRFYAPGYDDMYNAAFLPRYWEARKAVFGFYEGIVSGAVALPEDPALSRELESARGLMADFSEEVRAWKHRSVYDESIAPDPRDYDRIMWLFHERTQGRICSIVEASFPLGELQGAFGAILAALDAGIGKPNRYGFYDRFGVSDLPYAAMLVSEWTRDPWRIGGEGIEGKEDPHALVSAICAQFTAALKDPEPWRRCANCGRLFKYQIDHLRRDRRIAKHSDSPDCSKRCADTRRQWNLRHPDNMR